MNRAITADDLASASARLRAETVPLTMDGLSEREPELFGFIMTSINCVAGRLSLFDTPNAAVRETAEEMLELVLTCLMAARQCPDATE
jgi:hypothetical protein